MFIEVKLKDDLREFIDVSQILSIEETANDECIIYFKNENFRTMSIDSYNSIKMKIQAVI